MDHRPANQVDLRPVARFIIPELVVDETLAFLRRQGTAGHEGWVLWAGHIPPRRSSEFHVTRSIVPRQSTSIVHAYVESDEIAAIAATLDAQDEIIGLQIHSHPEAAFHSRQDEEGALVTKIGGVSIVVPRFARDALDDFTDCAVYRLAQDGWEGPLSPRAISTLTHVERVGSI